jgi:hypothetical protein
MSADKDRAIRREKQKRAKESKRQRRTDRAASTTGAVAQATAKHAS